MDDKTIIFTHAIELQKIAEDLKARYYNILGYIEIDKIFFAFKGGNIPDFFQYEIIGNPNDWMKYAVNAPNAEKNYCIAMAYNFYQFSDGPLLQWTMLDLLYSCDEKMNGRIRRKDIHEHSRIAKAIEEMGHSIEWRENTHLPDLLGAETIVFGLENESL